MRLSGDVSIFHRKRGRTGQTGPPAHSLPGRVTGLAHWRADDSTAPFRGFARFPPTPRQTAKEGELPSGAAGQRDSGTRCGRMERRALRTTRDCTGIGTINDLRQFEATAIHGSPRDIVLNSPNG